MVYLLKRWFSIVLVITAVLLFAFGISRAASVTLDDSGGRFYDNRGNWVMYVITATCVGNISDTEIKASSTGIVHGGPEGWCLWKVIADPGSPSPTIDSDVFANDSGGDDLLDGNGLNLLHNTTRKATFAEIDGEGVPSKQPVISTLTLDVDNQAEALGVFVITFIFVRP